MVAAVDRGDDYILPVLVDRPEIPMELPAPAIGVLRAEDHTPAEVAAHLLAKVRHAKTAGAGARDFGAAVRGSHSRVAD